MRSCSWIVTADFVTYLMCWVDQPYGPDNSRNKLSEASLHHLLMYSSDPLFNKYVYPMTQPLSQVNLTSTLPHTATQKHHQFRILAASIITFAPGVSAG